MIPSTRLSGIVVSLAALCAACASTTERVYIEPSNQTITAELEASYDGRGAQIYVTNGSSVPVIDKSVQ